MDMRLWDYLKMQLKKEIEKQEIVGYKFIDEVSCDIFCKDCATSQEKENAEEKNIITKKYKPGKKFFLCDRCGKIL